MTDNQPRILIIDDEPQIRRLLRLTLQAHAYDVLEAENGKDGLLAAASLTPDLVVLDMNLPDLHGLEVLKRLRDWFTNPIMVVSVVTEEETIVKALDLGADDYLTKPFSIPELLARLRVCLRRRQPQEAEPIFKSGALTADLARREVYVGGQQVHLTVTEYNLLRLFIQHAGKVLTHRFILKEVWGPHSVHDVQYVRVYLGHLRQKLEPDNMAPKILMTEPGIGYRLVLVEAVS